MDRWTLPLIDDTLCATLQTPTLLTHPFTHESLRTPFPYLFTDRVDEGEKEENSDDMCDFMVRLSDPTRL